MRTLKQHALDTESVERKIRLRDEFAMAALTGFCASRVSNADMEDIAEGVKGGRYVVGAAYALADAMMKAREQ